MVGVIILGITASFVSAFLSMLAVSIGSICSFLIQNHLSSKAVKRICWALDWGLVLVLIFQILPGPLPVRDFFIFWVVFTFAILVIHIRHPDVIESEKEI